MSSSIFQKQLIDDHHSITNAIHFFKKNKIVRQQSVWQEDKDYSKFDECPITTERLQSYLFWHQIDKPLIIITVFISIALVVRLDNNMNLCPMNLPSLGLLGVLVVLLIHSVIEYIWYNESGHDVVLKHYKTLLNWLITLTTNSSDISNDYFTIYKDDIYYAMNVIVYVNHPTLSMFKKQCNVTIRQMVTLMRKVTRNNSVVEKSNQDEIKK